MNVSRSFIKGIRDIIKVAGSDFELITPQGDSRSIRAAITSIGKDDGELVNAYGIEARVMYTLILDPAPKKFDRVTPPNGGRYIIEDAHALLINSAIVGYKCILKK